MNEKQIKEKMTFDIKTQEIQPNETLEPELKKARTLEMRFIANQGKKE